MRYFECVFNKNENVYCGVKRIFGIGTGIAVKVLGEFGISNKASFSDVEDSVLRLVMLGMSFFGSLGSDLGRKLRLNRQHKISMRHYKGVRYQQSLPVGGQRTHTNARTVKRLGFGIK